MERKSDNCMLNVEILKGAMFLRAGWSMESGEVDDEWKRDISLVERYGSGDQGLRWGRL